jgi:hypothetical protein
VRKISDDADMDIECVKRCLRVLHLYGCILVTGIFQFSNVYMLSCPDVMRLLDSSELRDIQRFSELPGAGAGAGGDRAAAVALLQLICAFTPGSTIGQLLFRHKNVLKGYDIRRLVAICQHHGIIRRIYRHPVLAVAAADAGGEGFIPGDPQSYVFTGASTLEAICFNSEITFKEVLEVMKPCLINK